MCGGAGEGLIDAAQRRGADVLVTGDLRHHVALDALTQGLALIDAGHHATESAALPAFADRLRAAARGARPDCRPGRFSDLDGSMGRLAVL